jgi:hypothetical protein
MGDVEKPLGLVPKMHAQDCALRPLGERFHDSCGLISEQYFDVGAALSGRVRFCALVSVLWNKDAQDAIGRIRQAPPVPVTAIVSPGDGVIDWHACIPEPSPLVELVIAGAHMTMSSNPDAQRIVAARLASPTSGSGY